MATANSFSVKLTLLENYLFQIDFGEYGNLITDEPEPLGSGEGPNPIRLLAASVVNCLAASLMFAIRKFKEEPGEIFAEITGNLERVDGRWRAQRLAVTLRLGKNADDISHMERALAQFEDFCIVTQSVRHGIAVNVRVFDRSGICVHDSRAVSDCPHHLRIERVDDH